MTPISQRMILFRKAIYTIAKRRGNPAARNENILNFIKKKKKTTSKFGELVTKTQPKLFCLPRG